MSSIRNVCAGQNTDVIKKDLLVTVAQNIDNQNEVGLTAPKVSSDALGAIYFFQHTVFQ